jgi:hypothetical protein
VIQYFRAAVIEPRSRGVLDSRLRGNDGAGYAATLATKKRELVISDAGCA